METRHASETKGFKVTLSELSKLRMVWDNFVVFLIPYVVLIAIFVSVQNYFSEWFVKMFIGLVQYLQKDGKLKKD